MDEHENRIIDISRNKESGEIEQFTVIEQGQPKLVKASPENILLYDPADDLPFEGGLRGFIEGSEALILSEEHPEVMIAPTGSEYCYVLRVNGDTVETTPKQAERVLRGIKDAAVSREFDGLVGLYDDIRSSQVRRDVINALRETFDEAERIEETQSGWLVDEFYVVDWTASMYAKTDNPDEADVKRSGSGVVEMDRSFEFVQLRLRRDVEPVDVRIDGDVFRLTEREMLFLAKINWLLDRRHYHPDREFWMNADQHAAVDWRTGEPEADGEDDESEPSTDSFNL
jgi:hypothetical protein